MRFISLTFFLCLLFQEAALGQERVRVGGGGFSYGNKKGYVYGTLLDKETNEPVIGAIVLIKSSEEATVTDINGDFRLRVPLGETLIEVQSVGFVKTQFVLQVGGEGKYKILVSPETTELDEIVVSGQRDDANVKSADVGKSSLSIESIKQLPMSMGEIDVIKSLTLLPGVNTNSELSTGFNVRGGGSDQNLVLLGNVPIYNPSHLFGFYTAFNSEVIDDVTLYKGGVPSKYGGRASSVLHVKYRDGDYSKWKGNISAGVVSSKITLEGPILKDRFSVLMSGRKSYINWMLKSFNDPNVKTSSADYYDLNAILNFRINDRNKLSYSYYRSNDDFQLAGDTTYNWVNQYHSLDWYYLPSDKLSFKLTGAISDYSTIVSNKSQVTPYSLTSEISNQILNADVEYQFSDELKLNAGVNFTTYELNPGFLQYKDSDVSQGVQNEFAKETAFFVGGEYEPSSRITLTAGLRYNRFNYLGAQTVYLYEEYRPKSEETIYDSIVYKNRESIQQYDGWEPRFSARFGFNESSSVKFGYNRMYQNIHLISNTTSIAPNDIWKLSDNYLKPQISEQISLGFYKNLRSNQYETSIEGYYKEVDNVIDYKDGAKLYLNNHVESELLAGRGRSYGLELYLRKRGGLRLTGWVSYTYSRSERQVSGPYESETINNGSWYYASFDRGHNLTNVIVYKLPKSWEFSSTITFKTGQPFTYPTGKIEYNNTIFPLYDERNNERSPNYHRLDISFSKKFKFMKRNQGDFNFSVYNVYGRKNPFSVFFQDLAGSPPQPYQLAILGVPFPSITVTLNF